MKHTLHAVTVGCLGLALPSAIAQDAPLDIGNFHSGISVTFEGENGRDWAVESTCHDPLLADMIVHLKPGTRIRLAHNENNVAMDVPRGMDRVLGAHGIDRQPNSGDEGEIRFKLDRDEQAHAYTRREDQDLPVWCRLYAAPFTLEGLAHEDGRPVLGSVGDNGKPYGASPSATRERFGYGVADALGNEWHTLTYWDDDSAWLAAQKIAHDKRAEASDGHWIALCAAPRTPLIQLRAPAGEQFYTTPLKTYHVPRIWEQTTYLTGGARISFANLIGVGPVRFRIDQGPWHTAAGPSLAARDLFPEANRPYALEAQCGEAGPALRRIFVRDPQPPASAEKHGLLLWPDDAALQAARVRLHDVEPFKTAYRDIRSDYYQGAGWQPDATRPGWRGGAGLCSTALANALVMAIEGADQAPTAARLAKDRLLLATRPEPVGQEISCDASSPATDFLQVLGQTTQAYADAGVAYDLVAAHFRSDQHAAGLTPVEEFLLRDNLAKCAKTLLQFRDIYSATSGGGDTHWSHGWELACGSIALAMPTYARPCFGVSGADLKSTNDVRNADGTYWNPWPDQGVTWWQAVTDPSVPTPGYPNIVSPFRAEFLRTDDGWWTGPNDLQADGDRYFGKRLVDVKYNGMSHANGVVELVEMHGYETPFVERLIVWDHLRRLRGDGQSPACVAAYVRRLLLQGAAALTWDATARQYRMQPRRQFVHALPAFNRWQPTLALPAAREGVTRWLADLKAYGADRQSVEPALRAVMEQERKALTSPYALALCEDPAALPDARAVAGPPALPPVIRPLFKHVIRPGQALRKDVQVFSPDGRETAVAVRGLPEGAAFDAEQRLIVWTPQPAQLGVHLLTITAANGLSTARPFLVVVSPEPLALPSPTAPTQVTATSVEGGRAVRLAWTPAPTPPLLYVVYRDGACWAVAPGAATDHVDRELIAPGQNTRYHVAAIGSEGGESGAVGTLIRVPPLASGNR